MTRTLQRSSFMSWLPSRAGCHPRAERVKEALLGCFVLFVGDGDGELGCAADRRCAGNVDWRAAATDIARASLEFRRSLDLWSFRADKVARGGGGRLAADPAVCWRCGFMRREEVGSARELERLAKRRGLSVAGGRCAAELSRARGFPRGKRGGARPVADAKRDGADRRRTGEAGRDRRGRHEDPRSASKSRSRRAKNCSRSKPRSLSVWTPSSGS